MHEAAVAITEVEEVIFRSDAFWLGTFRCPPAHPLFPDSGRTTGTLCVFPRSSVWIEHEGSPPFVAGPNVVTLYNPRQAYQRRAISGDGDLSDWISIAPAVVLDLLKEYEPSVTERPQQPFRLHSLPTTPRMYLEFRRILSRARGCESQDVLEVEEWLLDLLARLFGHGFQKPIVPTATGRLRDSVEAVKALLAREPERKHSISELARFAGVSPFHLSRLFRAASGMTIHRYQTNLRMRLSLDRLGYYNGHGLNVTDLALSFGYSSHSHFSATFRKFFGATPTEARKAIFR